MIPAEFVGAGFLHVDPKQVRQVERPTLLIQGQDNPAVFKRLIKYLEELLPQAELVEVANASHVTHQDNPGKYRSAVKALLNEIP